MNHAPFLAFIKDAQGRFLFYNERMAERFAVSQTEWLGKSDFEIWPESIAETMHRNDQDVIENGVPVDRMEETRDGEGAVTRWKVHKFTWRNESGQLLLGGIGVDVSEEMARQQELSDANLLLERLAMTDALTGLANRRVLDERVEYEIRVARRHGTKFSVVLLDLDNFKRRNDVYGHASGDEVLRRLGRLVISTLRFTDFAARYGGEELVVLLPGAGVPGSHIFAERLRHAIHETSWPDAPVTASFGTAELTEGVENGSALIALADVAMYEAKRLGKDRVVDFCEVPEEVRASFSCS
jgi:diguanylate cyclase (GGDEF)-like protein/PAS domain S-box-containing protein